MLSGIMIATPVLYSTIKEGSFTALAQAVTITTSTDGLGGTFFGDGVVRIVIEDDNTDDNASDDITVGIDADGQNHVSHTFVIDDTSDGSQEFEFFLVHEDSPLANGAGIDSIRPQPIIITFGSSADLDTGGPRYDEVSFEIQYGGDTIDLDYKSMAAILTVDSGPYNANDSISISIADQDANTNPTDHDQFTVTDADLDDVASALFDVTGAAFVDDVTFEETGDNTAVFEATLRLSHMNSPATQELVFSNKTVSLTLNDKTNYNDVDAPENNSVNTSQGSFGIKGPTLELSVPSLVPSGGIFTVSGRLTDENGTAMNDVEVQFTGDGAVFLPSTVTRGITFNAAAGKQIEIALCSECGHDSEYLRNTTHPADNKYLKLYEGGSISFPETTRGVTLVLQGMEQWPVTLNVTKDLDGNFATVDDIIEVTAQSQGMSPDFAVFKVSAAEDVVKEIEVLDVTGGGDYMAISSMMTVDFAGNPPEQHVIDFENNSTFPIGQVNATFVVNPGFFFSTGKAPADAEDAIRFVTARAPSIGIESEQRNYTITVATATDTQAGAGGEATISAQNDYTGWGDYATVASCGADGDLDGLCDAWEAVGGGIPFTKGDGSSGTLSLCFIDAYSGAWGGSNGQEVCPRANHKDVFVEIDYQEDHQLSQDAIYDVIKAFGGAYGTHPISNTGADHFGRTAGITLHVVQSEQIIDHTLEYIYAWKDASGLNGEQHDTNDNNDFALLKRNNFGTGTGAFGTDNIPDFQRNADVSGQGPTSSDIIMSDRYLGTGDSTPRIVRFGLPDIQFTTFGDVRGTIVVTTTAIFSSSVTVNGGTINGDVVDNYVTHNQSDPDFYLDIAISTASVTQISDRAFQVTTKIPFRSSDPGILTTTISVDRVQLTHTLTSNLPNTELINLQGPGAVVTTEVLDKLAWVYHYGMSVHGYNTVCSPSGLGEVGGNDFIISLGCDFDKDNNPPSHPDPLDPLNKYSVGNREDQAGTLMHELGHNLGLYHGAPKLSGASSSNYDANCKPNYLSVMTYSRQFPTYWDTDGTIGLSDAEKQEWREEGLDYSREALANLKESGAGADLDETVGLSVTSSIYQDGEQFIVWGSPDALDSLLPPGKKIATAAAGAGWRDWQYDDTQQSNIEENINNLGFSGCTGSGSTTNRGYNDWTQLMYSDFRTSGTSYDGAFAPPLSLPQEMSPKIHKDMQVQAWFLSLLKGTPAWIWLVLAIIVAIIALGIILALVLIPEYGLKWWTWLLIAVIVLAIIALVLVVIDIVK